MIPIELVDIFICLQSPQTRKDGLASLAAYTHATEAYLFGRDDEVDMFLPAQGLPQTMRYAAKWQAAFGQCEAGSCTSMPLPAPSDGADTLCSVIVDRFGQAVLVLLGIELEGTAATQLPALLSLVGAKLGVERVAESASVHAAVAREANRQAKSLNSALDSNRQELQKAFERLDKELAVRREAENKLRQADQKKDEFLAMLAHELRNPLAPINMAAQLITLPSSGKRQVERASEIINRQVAHMTSLLDDLLDVSRVTRGMITVEKEPVDAKAVIADAIEQSKSVMQSKRHQLNVHLVGEAVYLHGDKTRLVQIIANILVNAAKYTPSEGIVDLRLDATSDEVMISVRDNGIGMDSSLLPQVFELFVQAPRSSDRSQGGLGIGLALVKRLVELHGGGITAQSEGANRGSEFVVRLPRHREVLQAVAKSADNGNSTTIEALEIIVIDDNVDAANTLTALLESFGHRVSTGYCAQDALALTSTAIFDVIFLDIGLPDMDGHELAKKLRATDQSRGAVLVALTGYGQPQDKEQAKGAGFDVHLTKPAHLTAIAQVLNDVIEKHKVLRHRLT
jgi:signal transduction histidine kinase/ActR/RegA family two-component response regulator